MRQVDHRKLGGRVKADAKSQLLEINRNQAVSGRKDGMCLRGRDLQQLGVSDELYIG